MSQHNKSEHWAPCRNQTPSWYDWKIVESDVKPKQITTTTQGLCLLYWSFSSYKPEDEVWSTCFVQLIASGSWDTGFESLLRHIYYLTERDTRMLTCIASDVWERVRNRDQMDGRLRVLRPFNSISVISRRWKGEHERLCAMKRRLGSGRISPPAGFEPATPWSEVGSARPPGRLNPDQDNVTNINTGSGVRRIIFKRWLYMYKSEHWYINESLLTRNALAHTHTVFLWLFSRDYN